MPLLIKVKKYDRILKVRVFRAVVVTALLSTSPKRLSFNLIGGNFVVRFVRSIVLLSN